MIPTLGIPVLNGADLLFRCVKSVDHPIGTLFIVENSNGKNEELRSVCERISKRDFPNASVFGNIRIESHKNKGCGPSWNYIIKNSEGPWLIVGNDIAFLPGSLKSFDETLEKNPEADMIFGDGYNSFLMMEKGFKRIGDFDENFYPAYYEDVDHWYRGTLIEATRVGVPSFKRLHGHTDNPEDNSKKSNTIKSDPEIGRKNKVTSLNNHHYYIRKWGGAPHKETLKTPYGKDVPVTFWEPDKNHQRRNRLW